MTQKETEAIESSQDVNFVYSKRIITSTDDKEKTMFKEKIRIQIDHYLKLIMDSENEFNGLVEKSKSATLNAKEDERLLELDTFLAHSMNKKSALPKRLKEPVYLEKLDKLIKTTNDMLNEIKKDKK